MVKKVLERSYHSSLCSEKKAFSLVTVSKESSAVLILTFGRAKNRLKPELRTALDTSLWGLESRL
jgi:hypothetical protein